MNTEKFKILVDFDGTTVTHKWPNIGRDIGAEIVLPLLEKKGYLLILFTMRSGKELLEAENWFREKGISLYGINTDPDQIKWTTSPKAYGNLMIDDSAIGCPLFYPKYSRPFVNWVEICKELWSLRLINSEEYLTMTEELHTNYPFLKKSYGK